MSYVEEIRRGEDRWFDARSVQVSDMLPTVPMKKAKKGKRR